MGTEHDRVWELIEKIGFAMLSTLDGKDIRSRPMAAYVDRDEHAIYFLTDADSHKDEDIARHPNVGLAFADTGDQKYVSLTGRGRHFERPAEDQGTLVDAGEGMVGQPG